MAREKPNTGSNPGTVRKQREIQSRTDRRDQDGESSQHALTRPIAKNFAGRGIRVNAVAPGPVWTPFNPADRSAEVIPQFGQGSAMGRAAQPEELSPACVFLAAPVCSSYINGSVLEVIDGPTG